MKRLSIGSWISTRESKIIKRALEDRIGEDNVNIEIRSQYLSEALSFSKMRGYKEEELIDIAEEAIDWYNLISV